MADDANAEESALVFHPMDQFIVKPLFGDGPVHWYTPTNVTLWMALTILVITLLLVFATRGRAIVPTRMQSVAEMAYGFIYKMVEDVTGKDGVKYFPYIMTLFMFIVVANFLGLLPMAFTTTSHIAVTAGLLQARCRVSQRFLDLVGAFGVAPDPRCDRGHFLLRSPG